MVRSGVIAMTMNFCVLGDVEARSREGVVDLGHARQRCVLAVFLVDVNRVVTVDQLIDRVWADHPPQRARGAVYSYVSRLRQALSPTEDIHLARRPGGYVLSVDPMTVDLHFFRTQVARIQEAETDGDAAALCSQALGIWRGEAFATLDTAWLNGIRDTLEAERFAVELDRNDIELRRGQHARLLSQLSSHAGEHPLDERLSGQLMLALYRCGRQSGALDLYQQARLRLVNELGVEPGPALRQLHHQILTNASALNLASRPVVVAIKRPSWPVVVGEAPLVATAFQERPDVQARLDTAMRRAGSTTVITQVLSGDGGIGKTQMAAAIFDRGQSSQSFQLFVWVTATSTEAAITAYAHALARVDPDASTADPRAAASRFLTWLRETSHPWLVVLDDVADPDDLTGWWPAGPHGRTLVTTRRQDALLSEDGRTVIDLSVYEPSESLQYLEARLSTASTRSDVLDGASDLAADLGHLPLALAQASAVILDSGLTCAEYRSRLTNQTATLARVFPTPLDSRRKAVASTWRMAINAANTLSPMGFAGPVLDLIAVLEPNGIPHDLLVSDAVARYVTDRVQRTAMTKTGRTEATSAERLREAIRNLGRLSLISHDPADGFHSVRMHPLAQRATREALHPATMRTTYHAAADALVAIWPDNEHGGNLSAVLRRNAAALIGYAHEALWEGHSHPILYRVGRSLADVGLVHEAVQYWHEMLTVSQRILGPDHPDTLTTRGNLAYSQGLAGDLTAAPAAFQELLADRLRILGLDHPDTLTTRHNLAYSRGRAGDPAWAAAAFQELLADRLRILGPDHPDTLRTRAHAARWQGLAGDPAGAFVNASELVTDQVRVLGADHRDTLATRGAVAFWQGVTGDATGAFAANTALLVDRIRVMGAQHPDTVAVRGHLAYLRGAAGDPTGARIASEAVLVDLIKIAGPDHPNTLTLRYQITYWRALAGDPTGAAAALTDILADRLRILGAEHPDTVLTRESVAYLEQCVKDSAEPEVNHSKFYGYRLRQIAVPGSGVQIVATSNQAADNSGDD
jgi:DNA-binding SARP family transcriptional activator